MTISSATNKVIYTADGVLTDFDFTFKTKNASDIQVYLDDVLQGSGYTVNLNSDQEVSPGGETVFDTAPADQVITAIVREVPLNQEVDYQPYDPFPANTHEGALDKLTMQNQQQQEELDRATKASISDDGTTDYTLPLYNAGKAIMWDEVEKKMVNSDDNLNDITDTAQQSADDAAVSAAAADSSADDSAASAVQSAGYATDADNTLKDFETKYLGSKTSDPTLDNEGNALIDGALYYNTTNNVMRVYDLGTTSWADVGSSTAQIYQYSSTSAGQTVITGADDNANVLTYVAGFIQVYYNGQLLQDSDYTETDSSTITLADGIKDAGDSVQILAFGTFDVANTYTKAEADANFQLKGRSPWTVAYNGTPGSVNEIEVTGIPNWVNEIKILAREISSNTSGDEFNLQLGNASSYLTSGYLGSWSYDTSSGSHPTDKFHLSVYSDSVIDQDLDFTLTRVDGNVWHVTGNWARTNGAASVGLVIGHVDVTATLTRLRVYWDTVGVFNNGDLTILYR